MALLKINSVTLKDVCPPPLQHRAALATSVLCVLWSSLGSWCITSAAHITRHTLPSFHPHPPPLPWFHTSVPKFTLFSLFLSPPHFLLTAGKNFVHTSSKPGTKLHFVTTTCPSASSDQDGGRHHQTASTPAWVSARGCLSSWTEEGAGWGVISGFMEESREVPGFILFSFLFNKL